MRHLLISAAAIALLAVAPALAQDRHDHEHGGHDANAPAPAAQPAPAAHGTPQLAPNLHFTNPGAARAQFNSGAAPDHRGARPERTAPAHTTPAHTAPAPATQHGDRGRTNDRGRSDMHGNDHGHSNVDISRYRRNVHAPQRFHAGSYRRPDGWYYHRWTYGAFLPRLFWSHQYWLDDYGAYGLETPPPGYVWVRYGSDALLIEENSGEIIQVEYNVFY